MHRTLFGSTRRRVLSVLACLAFLGGAGFGAASLASAAPENPALTGKRVWCVDANGFMRVLNAPCSQYPEMWYLGPIAVPGAAGYTEPAAAAPVDTTPAVKRETNVTVTVDFDATKPITVTGLPPYRAGSPELWGDNTGSIADAAADIVVLRANTATTDCGTLGLRNAVTGNAPAASVIGDASVAASARQVGSTVQKFCVYPRHISATTVTGGSSPVIWSDGFLAGQSYKLNVWVYAP